MPPNANAEHDVYMTYANRESGAIRPIFYYVRIENGGFVATQIGRGQFTLGDGFGGPLLVMWMRNHGFLNTATNYTTAAGQEAFTDVMFLDWAHTFADYANSTSLTTVHREYIDSHGEGVEEVGATRGRCGVSRRNRRMARWWACYR